MVTKVRVLEEEDAVPEIVRAIGDRRVLRINGHSGHGKTRLAKALSNATGWRRITLDDYMRPPEGAKRVLDRIDSERMRADISDAIDADGAIIEGILIDQVIPVDSFGHELRVYMLSLFSPEWDDDERRRRSKLGTKLYHQEFRPELRAEIMVLKAAD